MTKRRQVYPYQRGVRKFDFNQLVDISATVDESGATGSELASGSYKAIDGHTISVGTPFKGEEQAKNGLVGWFKDISIIYKIATVVGSIVLAVVVRMVWWAAMIDNNVSDLKDDVKSIKLKIETLAESSVATKTKIDSMEKGGRRR